MPRTYITAADGTLYEAIPARKAMRRKIIRRTIAGIILIITALFLSAAIIGLQRAAIDAHTPRIAHTSSSHRLPNRDELEELADARRAQPGMNCHLEWDGPAYPGYEAICSPKPKARTFHLRGGDMITMPTNCYAKEITATRFKIVCS